MPDAYSCAEYWCVVVNDGGGDDEGGDDAYAVALTAVVELADPFPVHRSAQEQRRA